MVIRVSALQKKVDFRRTGNPRSFLVLTSYWNLIFWFDKAWGEFFSYEDLNKAKSPKHMLPMRVSFYSCPQTNLMYLVSKVSTWGLIFFAVQIWSLPVAVLLSSLYDLSCRSINPPNVTFVYISLILFALLDTLELSQSLLLMWLVQSALLRDNTTVVTLSCIILMSFDDVSTPN